MNRVHQHGRIQNLVCGVAPHDPRDEARFGILGATPMKLLIGGGTHEIEHDQISGVKGRQFGVHVRKGLGMKRPRKRDNGSKTERGGVGGNKGDMEGREKRGHDGPKGGDDRVFGAAERSRVIQKEDAVQLIINRR